MAVDRRFRSVVVITSASHAVLAGPETLFFGISLFDIHVILQFFFLLWLHVFDIFYELFDGISGL